ncbi:hypothetical protein [Tunturiibacter gelidiferens]|uniref:hypothetical protein n=1 Tax=Tunturiibacter gelidiferens TaxID=3069689 RepID=UPI003D9AD538
MRGLSTTRRTVKLSVASVEMTMFLRRVGAAGQRTKANAGSLHCATDDETVRRFGRDDDVFCGGWEMLGNGRWRDAGS